MIDLFEDLDRLQKIYDDYRASDPARAAHIVPKNRDELWTHIAQEYDFEIPRKAVCAGHVSPFETPIRTPADRRACERRDP